MRVDAAPRVPRAIRLRIEVGSSTSFFCENVCFISVSAVLSLLKRLLNIIDLPTSSEVVFLLKSISLLPFKSPGSKFITSFSISPITNSEGELNRLNGS